MAHHPIGIILTAGLGTRLRPLTLFRPKPMMEILGRPIIFFLIRMLEQAGIRDVFLNLHHEGEHIRKYIAATSFCTRIHLVHEKEILGTAGGVKNILQTFNLSNRQMVVLHGDIICDLDLSPIIRQNNFCTLICAKDQTVAGYTGSVGINRQNEIVTLGRFFHANGEVYKRGFFTGIQVLSSEALHLVRASHEQSLVAEVYPRWLKSGYGVKAIVKPVFYDDLGTAARIFQANMSLLNEHRVSYIDYWENLATLPGQENFWLGKNTNIDKTAVLISPLIIADHARIGKNTIIGPNVVIGENASVHERACVSNSVVLAKTIVEKDEKLNCMMALRSARVLVKG